MNKKDLRIVFMGTPEFAVPSLEILVENGFNVVGVITATDKYGGRGKSRLIESAVKKAAVRMDIPVLQPKNLKNPEFIDTLRNLKADLQVVVAFRMLPVVVWDMPTLGTINLHGSLLPKYRGAAPINWAIIQGEHETGLTTFKLKHEIDTGDLIYQDVIPINERDTAGDLHDRMMDAGAKLVLKTIEKVASGSVEYFPQDNSQVSKAPKIYHDDCEINFNQPVRKVYDFIRGLSPYPVAWTTLNGQQLNIIKATYELVDTTGSKTGSIETDNKRYLKIACRDGWIQLERIQLQGRKRMNIKDFLNGYTIEADHVG